MLKNLLLKFSSTFTNFSIKMIFFWKTVLCKRSELINMHKQYFSFQHWLMWWQCVGLDCLKVSLDQSWRIFLNLSPNSNQTNVFYRKGLQEMWPFCFLVIRLIVLIGRSKLGRAKFSQRYEGDHFGPRKLRIDNSIS